MAFYTTFFSMWVFTPIPIEICYGLLRDALPFCDMKLTLVCVSTTSGLLHDVFQWVSVHPHPHWNLLWIAQRRLPFCDMKLTLLVSSLLCGLLHDVFQNVSVHPHPHWNLLHIAHWNLLRIAQRRLPFCDMKLETNSFLCLYHFWPSTRRFSVCECSPHPHWNLLRIRYFSFVNETKIFFFCQKFNRGADGKCTICSETEGNHYAHSNGNKYCVSICLHLCLNSL
jgi:hypothetical protein